MPLKINNPEKEKYFAREIGADEYDLWDNFVYSCGGSLFQTAKWFDLVASACGAAFKIIICQRDGKIQGGCPVYQSGGLEGKIASTPPLTPYAGIVLGRASGEREIPAMLIDYIEKSFDFAVLINHPAIMDVRPFVWKGWESSVRYTYYRDKTAQISPDIIRRAQRAREAGIQIRQDLDPERFYGLFGDTLSRQNINQVVSRDEFLNIFCALKEKGIASAFSSGVKNQEQSACILLKDRDCLFYWMASSAREGNSSGASQLLIADILEKFTGSFENIDFLGADIEGVSFYKSGFGVRLVPHYQVSKACSFRGRAIRSLKQAYKILKK